ncbi:MAG: hypothetical protein L6Q54_04615 [Leptospiraceae bacterium]|nr:hypothetical protein [Leptospiraceae bacterium]
MKAWLIDIWNLGNLVQLWLKQENGKNVFLKDEYFPRIYSKEYTSKGRAFLSYLYRENILRSIGGKFRKELWSGNTLKVSASEILDYNRFQKIVKKCIQIEEHIEFYNTEIPFTQFYQIEKDLYPLSKVDFTEANGQVEKIERSLDDENTLFPKYPSFRKIFIESVYGKFKPITEGRIIVHISLTEKIILPGREIDLLTSLNELLLKIDPDIIYTSHGDEFLFPNLFQLAYKNNIKLLLDRSDNYFRKKHNLKGRTIFTYGRVVFKTTPYPLYGRLHIDKGLSFFYTESELEGILEMAKFSRLSIQKLARSSPGSAMSSMEDEFALKSKILIPRQKGKSSSIKPVSVVLKADNGGLTFRPITGIHENVVELDFRSLFPNLMKLHNISGETINCKCCSPSLRPVPYLPYHTCTKRKGIVGETIGVLLDRRDEIKKILLDKNLTKKERGALELRASAIKWCLVTSFGYTGFKHAKFGQREANEAITAWSRHSLLTAKEISEDYGFILLHALTDSLWLHKKDFPTSLVNELCKKINSITGLNIIHEASYSWICFPYSKTRDYLGTPTRYFARENNGKLKVRGLLNRKKDTPGVILSFQEEVLNVLSKASSVKEIESFKNEIFQIYDEYKSKIEEKKISKESLVIYKTISKPFSKYEKNNASKIVLSVLEEKKISMQGGQSIDYIAVNTKSSDKNTRYIPSYLYNGKYDVLFYKNILKEALLELMPFEIATKSEEWKLEQGSLF